ncbi:hypothetical protein B0H12DRAFT_1237095 [Mycena haematopus]|nr:hypothetical protein B0H12DRAFT_1237095 [Mycena haematopus]
MIALAHALLAYAYPNAPPYTRLPVLAPRIPAIEHDPAPPLLPRTCSTMSTLSAPMNGPQRRARGTAPQASGLGSGTPGLARRLGSAVGLEGEVDVEVAELAWPSPSMSTPVSGGVMQGIAKQAAYVHAWHHRPHTSHAIEITPSAFETHRHRMSTPHSMPMPIPMSFFSALLPLILLPPRLATARPTARDPELAFLRHRRGRRTQPLCSCPFRAGLPPVQLRSRFHPPP